MKAADGEQLLRAQHRLYLSEQNLAAVRLYAFDAAAALEFERLRALKKLRKVGLADLLIGSIALTWRATLVTRNVRHFRQIPGLRVENWAD